RASRRADRYVELKMCRSKALSRIPELQRRAGVVLLGAPSNLCNTPRPHSALDVDVDLDLTRILTSTATLMLTLSLTLTSTLTPHPHARVMTSIGVESDCSIPRRVLVSRRTDETWPSRHREQRKANRGART